MKKSFALLALVATLVISATPLSAQKPLNTCKIGTPAAIMQGMQILPEEKLTESPATLVPVIMSELDLKSPSGVKLVECNMPPGEPILVGGLLPRVKKCWQPFVPLGWTVPGMLPISAPGKDGRGIAKMRITDGGDLIVVYTDATEANLGRVVGREGRDFTPSPVITYTEVRGGGVNWGTVAKVAGGAAVVTGLWAGVKWIVDSRRHHDAAKPEGAQMDSVTVHCRRDNLNDPCTGSGIRASSQSGLGLIIDAKNKRVGVQGSANLSVLTRLMGAIKR